MELPKAHPAAPVGQPQRDGESMEAVAAESGGPGAALANRANGWEEELDAEWGERVQLESTSTSVSAYFNI